MTDRRRLRARRTTVALLSGTAVTLASTTGALSADAAAPTLSAAGPTAADHAVLTAWNVIAQTEAVTVRPTAHGQSRGIAMVQGAVYDAVNAIDRGHQA